MRPCGSDKERGKVQIGAVVAQNLGGRARHLEVGLGAAWGRGDCERRRLSALRYLENVGACT